MISVKLGAEKVQFQKSLQQLHFPPSIMVFNCCSNFTKVGFQLALTGVFCISELITGYATGNNVLIADSFHMFSDVVSLTVSIIAIYKKDKDSDSSRKTFGYRRSEPLGCLVHGALLVGLAFSVGTEAITDIIYKATGTGDEAASIVDSDLLPLIVGSCGLIVDTFGLLLFWQEDMEGANMNVRSLFLEKIGDFVGTTVVILSTALGYFFRCDVELDPENESTCLAWVKFVDPAGTLLMATILLIAAHTIFKMTVRILMCDAPSKFPMEEMKLELEKNHRVTVLKNNVWQVDADELIISLVVCAGGGPSTALTSSNDVDRLRDDIHQVLERYGAKFETTNITIQINCDSNDTFDGIRFNEERSQIEETPRKRALSTLRTAVRSSRSPTQSSNFEVKIGVNNKINVVDE